MPGPAEIVAICLQADVPGFWMSPPGAGKSTIIRDVSMALGMRHKIIPGGQAKDDDLYLNAIHPSGDFCKRLPAEWILEGLQAHQEHGQLTAVLVDELTTMTGMVRKGWLTALTERVIGSHDLHGAFRWIAAGNPAEIAVDGADLEPPMANRFLHFEGIPTVEDWRNWMLSGGTALPRVPICAEGWEKRISYWNALLVGFSHFSPSLFANEMPRGITASSGPWPSRRTWTWAAKVLAACESTGSARHPQDLGEVVDLQRICVSGLVGPGAATSFFAWLAAQDLPNPADLLQDPGSFVLPTRADLQFSVLASVVAHALEHMSQEAWNASWQILDRAREQGAPDVAATCGRALASLKYNRQHPLYQQVSAYPLPMTVAEFYPFLKAAGLVA